MVRVFHDIIHGDRGHVHGGVKGDPADLLEDQQAARCIGSIIGDCNGHAVTDFIQACVPCRIQSGGYSGDGADAHQVAVIVGIEIGFNIRGMLFHIHVHIAGFQHLVGDQQVTGFHDFQGIALFFQNGNDSVFEEFSIRSLGLGVTDHGFFFCQSLAAQSQKQGGNQKDRKQFFHTSSPFHISFSMLHPPSGRGRITFSGAPAACR